jgi:hypothetical protein
MNIDWSKSHTVMFPESVEDWHDGLFRYHERMGLYWVPTIKLINFQPLYILEPQDFSSFEEVVGIVKDGLFYVKSCRFEGRYYVADALDNS